MVPIGRPPEHSPRRFLIFLLAAFAVSAFFRFHNPTVPDPDSLYHLRHAHLYVERGPLLKSFPWIVYSTVNRFSSDIGYGFHVLLIPFSLLRNPVLGIKLAALFETIAVMAMLYATMRRQGILYYYAWPFVLLFLGPPMLYTFLMARPQTLTMGFAALLLSFMVAGGTWGVLLSSLAISFVHLNISLVIPVVVVTAGVVKGINERVWEWRKAAAALIGLGLGWLLRPNPLGTAKLEYVQVVVHALIRQKRIPLLFGREWLPLAPAEALSIFSAFVFIWAILAAVFLVAALVRRGGLSPRDRTFLWGSLALSLIFYAVTILNTKRATPLWGVFAVMFVAKAFTSFLDPAKLKPGQLLKHEPRLALALLVGTLFALMVWDVTDEHVIQRRWLGRDPYRLKAASDWLRHNSRPGEVVFNVSWGAFPELFFWNTHNYYVSGLDPVFLFAYDERLYWKAHHLATGEATSYTSGAMDYRAGTREDTYTVLRRDFNASYILVERRRNMGLSYYLETNPHFTRCFQDKQVSVYQIAPSRAPAAVGRP